MNSRAFLRQAPLWRRCLLGAVLAFTGLGLAACGGGGGGIADSGSGTAVIGLTDADGDFVTYVVDVSSLTLTRRDGAVVDVLPEKTRVDFAQYTDLTEFLTAASVPTGFYTRAHLVLDYSNADIRAAQGDGVVQLAPQDGDGNPLGTLDVTVTLDDNRPLPIAPGIPAHLTLDFDLQATNTVDLGAATVTVQPLLVADVDPQAPKPHRVRGPLSSVDTADSSFKVSIRPFHLRAGDLGTLNVRTDDNTVFEIDGVSYQGAAGLAALNAEPAFTATIARGELQVPAREFMATEVMAGSSVSFGTFDVVRGSVTARSGDTLIVRGASLVRQDGTLIFNDDVTVTLDASTRVSRELDSDNSHSPGDISVGQRITALGALSGAPGSYTLDTANGVVRMRVSTVAGHVVQTASAPMTVSVQTINGRPVSIYSFNGTDADPNNYRIDTGSLSLASLADNEPVRVRGFVQPFATGLDHDFDAISVIDLSGVPAWMAVGWTPPTAAAFDSLSGIGMVVDLSASDVHKLVQRGVVSDLSALTGMPTVAPAADGKGLYAITLDGSVQIYTTYESFSAGLTDQLAAHAVRRVLARGAWDSATGTVSGHFAAVNLR